MKIPLSGIHVYAYSDKMMSDAIRCCARNGIRSIRYAIVSLPIRGHETDAVDFFSLSGNGVYAEIAYQTRAQQEQFITYVMEAHAARIKRFESECQANNIQIVVDMHSFLGAEYDFVHHKRPIMSLFVNSIYQDLFIHAWNVLTENLANVKSVCAFDLINEPCFIDSDEYVLFMEYLARNVRAIDSDRTLIVEGLRDDLMSLRKINFEPLRALGNLVLSGHWYWKTSFTVQRQGAYGGSKFNFINHKKRISSIIRWAKRNNWDLYVGEIGITPDESPSKWVKSGAHSWFADACALFRAYSIPLAFHAFTQDPVGWEGMHYQELVTLYRRRYADKYRDARQVG